MKSVLAVGWAVALLAAPSARAASASAPATNAPAPAAKPADAMTALFGDPVIAKGKGFEIKQSELDTVVTGFKSSAAASGRAIPPAQVTQLEGQLLNRLIQIQLLLQKATPADKTAGAQKADLQLSNLLAKADSPELLERQLKAAGMTMAGLRSRITQESTAQTVLTRELNVNITDADVKKFYDDNPADFERPEMVHARHILLMTIDPVTRTPLSDDQQKAKRKQADDLLKRIRGGADFAALAKQYSEDSVTKENGGELPEFPRGQMVPEFEAAAFSLTNNQVSDIVTSTYGYHIIKLIDKSPAKKLTLSDKVPGTEVTIADRVKDVLTQQKIEKLAPAYLEKLKAAADIEIVDPDLKAVMAAISAAAATNLPAAAPEK
ncbi:MAG TPA: peptidylprolyl isomerase [Candidatus Acidoferrum sp.]|nr:peptidylprolyl isomerase [Candidatus Acidoferrum sp.]